MAPLQRGLVCVALLHMCASAAPGSLHGGFSSLKVADTTSFSLGGEHSSSLLAGWTATTESYPMRGPGNRTRVRTVYFQPTANDTDTVACTVRTTASPADFTNRRCQCTAGASATSATFWGNAAAFC